MSCPLELSLPSLLALSPFLLNTLVPTIGRGTEYLDGAASISHRVPLIPGNSVLTSVHLVEL